MRNVWSISFGRSAARDRRFRRRFKHLVLFNTCFVHNQGKSNLNRDLERPDVAVYSAQAHKSIMNAIDGCGGLNLGHGAPEIATGGRDGTC